jgi:LCP family protein required for cell wall assembly
VADHFRAEPDATYPADAQQAGIYRGRRRRVRRLIRSPARASVLSFIWPGLGQWYARQRLRALFYALPPTLLIVGLGVAMLLGPEVFVLRLLAPSFALIVIALIGLHALWRVASIVDAWRRTRREPLSRDRSVPLVVVLSLVVLLTHGFAGYYVQSFAEAGDKMFGGGDPGRPPSGPLDDILGAGPTPTPGSTPMPGASPTPAAAITPDPTAPPALDPNARVTVLFVGVDSGPGRDHALTDSLIVASLDPRTNEVAMVSVARDTGRVPMFDGGRYEPRINSFLGYARRNPDRFPQGPINALVRQMEYLVGIPIDYYAVTDMAGFRAAVDEVGGVNITVDRAINDGSFVLEPGRYHMDGELALRYARSRHGPGNSDFVRARRQQQLIYALAQRVRDPAVLARLPQVMDTIEELIRTDAPVEAAPELMAMLSASEGATTTQTVLAPNAYAQRIPPEEVGGRYMIELKMDAVAALSVELFGDESRYARSGGE